MSAKNALDPDPAKRCGSVSITLTVEVELGTSDEAALAIVVPTVHMFVCLDHNTSS
jgi:hypothetical protein